MKRTTDRLIGIVVLLALVLSIGVCFCTGCSVNPAAENFSDLVFKHHEQIIIEHQGLSDGEKELLIINLLQTQGLNQDEIHTKIDEYRAKYNWHQKQTQPE